MSLVLDNVLLYLRKHGPSTLVELSAGIGISEHGVAMVITALVMGGMLKQAGRTEYRRYRLSRKGWAFINELHPPTEIGTQIGGLRA